MPSETLRRIGLAFAAALLLGGCSPAPDGSGAQPRPAADTRGMDAEGLARALEAARDLRPLHALLVARHGETLLQARLRGPDMDTPVNIKSASKSVLSALTGVAIERGVLEGADQPIAPILAADLPSGADPRIGRITVGHLMSMQAGLGSTSGQNYGAWATSPNWVRHALSRPFTDEPGGRMIYSTGSSHLLSAVLTRAAGRSTHELATAWLAEPLGVNLPPWPRDPQGVYFGGNDMLMSPRGLLRFGELYRQDGMFEGQRVLPEGWAQESWRARTRSPWSGHDYGYGWFTKRAHGHQVHFAWGYGGQMLFVVPTLGLTVVMISDPSPRPERDGHVDALHRLLDDHLIPAALQGA